MFKFFTTTQPTKDIELTVMHHETVIAAEDLLSQQLTTQSVIENAQPSTQIIQEKSQNVEGTSVLVCSQEVNISSASTFMLIKQTLDEQIKRTLQECPLNIVAFNEVADLQMKYLALPENCSSRDVQNHIKRYIEVMQKGLDLLKNLESTISGKGLDHNDVLNILKKPNKYLGPAEIHKKAKSGNVQSKLNCKVWNLSLSAVNLPKNQSNLSSPIKPVCLARRKSSCHR